MEIKVVAWRKFTAEELKNSRLEPEKRKNAGFPGRGKERSQQGRRGLILAGFFPSAAFWRPGDFFSLGFVRCFSPELQMYRPYSTCLLRSPGCQRRRDGAGVFWNSYWAARRWNLLFPGKTYSGLARFRRYPQPLVGSLEKLIGGPIVIDNPLYYTFY